MHGGILTTWPSVDGISIYLYVSSRWHYTLESLYDWCCSSHINSVRGLVTHYYCRRCYYAGAYNREIDPKTHEKKTKFCY